MSEKFPGQRAADIVVGVLIVGALTLPLLIDVMFGAAIIASVVLMGIWIFGVRKYRVEKALREAARETELDLEHHVFSYSTLAGRYHGHPVRVEVGATDDLGRQGATVVATSTASEPFGARNFARIRMLATEPSKGVRWSARPGQSETVIELPLVSASREELIIGLQEACEVVEGRAS
jgi:hypothetical protein